MSNVVKFPVKPKSRIEGFLHCSKCSDETPEGWDVSDFSDYEVGLTKYGLEVWCNRHQEVVFYHNLLDVWTTVNLLKQIRGEEPMKIVEADRCQTDRLIHTIYFF